jgi:hypothetical protein
MDWTRSDAFRGVVVALLLVYVVVQATLGDWTWVAIGTALLVLNLVLWAVRAPAAPAVPGSSAPTTEPLVPVGVDSTLADLLDRPGVQQAWSAGPAIWQQVSYLDDEDDLELPAHEVADYVCVSSYDDETVRQTEMHWSVAVGDELKPLLDLDVDEGSDPLVATLAGHPSVDEVQHSDREQYQVALRAPMTLDDMAVLAARGLVAHHLEAVRRLRPPV